MGRGVAKHGERVGVVGVARGQDLDRRAVCERRAEILRLPVDANEHRLLGELRADRARGVEAGGAGRKLELGGVRQDDVHG